MSETKKALPVIQPSFAVVSSRLWQYFIHNKDKNTIDKWINYFEGYVRHFESIRARASPQNKIILLEIGVQNGGAMPMWLDYFGPNNCFIYGIDIDPKCESLNSLHPAIKVFIGSQEDRKFLKSVMKKIPPPDIILDDGGHTMNQQITSFKVLYPYLKNGGVYVCEDTHSSYWTAYGGGHKKPGTFIEHAKDVIDTLSGYHYDQVSDYTLTCSSIHFYDSIVFFEKPLVNRSVPVRYVIGNKQIIPNPLGFYKPKPLK